MKSLVAFYQILFLSCLIFSCSSDIEQENDTIHINHFTKSTSIDYNKMLDVVEYVSDNYTINDFDQLSDSMIQDINEGSGLNSSYLNLTLVNTTLDNISIIENIGIENFLLQNGFSSSFVDVYYKVLSLEQGVDLKSINSYNFLNIDEKGLIDRVSNFVVQSKSGRKGCSEESAQAILYTSATAGLVAGALLGGAPGAGLGFLIGGGVGFMRTAVKGGGC